MRHFNQKKGEINLLEVHNFLTIAILSGLQRKRADFKWGFLEKQNETGQNHVKCIFQCNQNLWFFMFRTFLSPSSILWTEKLNNIAASPMIIPVTTAAAIVEEEGKNSRDAMQSEGV